MSMQERIRRARRRAGLSQSELAELLDVRRSAVSNWEAVNDIQPSLVNLIAIARTCGVSIEWLGTGRGGIAPEPESMTDIPTADAELVEAREERELLAGFRNLPRKSQQLVVELVGAMQSGRRRTQQK